MALHVKNHNAPEPIDGAVFGINHCLSCGTTKRMGKRRYCSIDCRQTLRHALNIRTGLLKALRVKYATFYFTKISIIMDTILFSGNNIYSFIYPRSEDQIPADDFRRMTDELGNAWWAEKRRTNRRYLAAYRVLKKAKVNDVFTNSVSPIETKIPSIKGSALVYLNIERSKLGSAELERVIKTAYRRQAKQSHPDLGGDPDMFRKIHDAYEELAQWAENPRFLKRRGFPDKWFYDGDKNRWIQPTPHIKQSRP
jgi:hypothetical protein